VRRFRSSAAHPVRSAASVVDEAATGTITANATVSVAAGGIDLSPTNDERIDTNTVVSGTVFQNGFE
jgi:hypothetical protein